MAFSATLVVRHRVDLRIAAGLVGLAAAIALRVRVAGVSGSHSVPAGLLFGVVVAALAAVLVRRNGPVSRLGLPTQLTLGVAGAVVLCLPAALRHLDGATSTLAIDAYAPWAIGVTVVALAEEALLRGTLFTALDQRAGTAAAITVTSVAFALVHVPLYGTAVLPLDLAVGVFLGMLRAVTGSVTVPAVTHTLADLAGWWLR